MSLFFLSKRNRVVAGSLALEPHPTQTDFLRVFSRIQGESTKTRVGPGLFCLVSWKKSTKGESSNLEKGLEFDLE